MNAAILSGVCMTSLAASVDSLNQQFKNYRPVVTIFGGPSWINLHNRSMSLAGTDDETFTYQTKNPGSANGYGGGFLGVEWTLPYHNFFIQLGVEYDKFGSTKLKGSSLAGIQDDTSTSYQYSYQIATQQAIAAVKLLGILDIPKVMSHQLYPYFSVALGAAFNKARSFTTSTAEDVCSANLTPTFANGSDTNFSYNIGLGVDTDIAPHFRLGIGYRYSNFGQISLGQGAVTVNQYRSSIDSSLHSSNVSENQFLAQLTFIA